MVAVIEFNSILSRQLAVLLKSEFAQSVNFASLMIAVDGKNTRYMTELNASRCQPNPQFEIQTYVEIFAQESTQSSEGATSNEHRRLR